MESSPDPQAESEGDEPSPPPSNLRKAMAGAACALAILYLAEVICGLILAEEKINLPGKQDGLYRIIVAGGSTVAGEPILEFGFVRQLGALLNQQEISQPFEIVNLGVPAKDSNYSLKVVKETANDDPDLYIIYSAQNEFLGPRGHRRKLVNRVQSLALVRMAQHALDRKKEDAHTEWPLRVSPFPRDADWFKERIEIFKANYDEMADAASQNGTPIFFCTAVSNLADWPPLYRLNIPSQADGAYDDEIRAIQHSLDSGDTGAATSQLEAARKRFKNEAMLSFLSGQLSRQTGNHEKARKDFFAAKENDPFPWRARSPLNQHIRGFANHGDGVAVVDLEKAFIAAKENGYVGFELIADSVHPSPLGSAVIAIEVAKTMARHKYLIQQLKQPANPEAWLNEFKQGLGTDKTESHLRELDFKNALFCMKGPFYDYGLAIRLLTDSVARWPDDWKLKALMCIASHKAGKKEDALRWFTQVNTQKGTLGDADIQSVPYLEKVLNELKRH
ncbi:MAG: hypothetical protein QGG53_22475 [Planctomycetota bacterium]|nr:hypothetical protein [Planctomycetota bacterium]